MNDANVEAVREKLLRRSQIGFIKYGTTTERDDLSAMEWLQHLQEELMDACVYIEAFMRNSQRPKPMMHWRDMAGVTEVRLNDEVIWKVGDEA
jgi:hypothetical protein